MSAKFHPAPVPTWLAKARLRRDLQAFVPDGSLPLTAVDFDNATQYVWDRGLDGWESISLPAISEHLRGLVLKGELKVYQNKSNRVASSCTFEASNTCKHKGAPCQR